MINRSLIRHLLNNQIIVALLVIAVGWLLLEISGVVVAGFIAYILMAAIAPLVNALHARKIPKVIAAALSYIFIAAVLVLLIFPLVPFFSKQISQLFKGLPIYIHNAAELAGFTFKPGELQAMFSSEATSLGKNALEVTTRIFGGFFTLLTIIVLSFYLLMDQEGVQKSIASLFAPSARQKALKTINKVEDKLGAWLRGQIILSVFIGVITWISLSLIGLEFALPLALLAGMLEIVPTIGPIISAVPALIVALSISPTMALLVGIIYILIQLAESHFLVPRVMHRSVGLHPIVVILGIIIGGRLLGVVGALLAVPFIALIVVVASEINNQE